LFAAGGASGSATTGNWVSNGLQFFLVDAASEATLATLTVTTTAGTNCGAGTLTLTPDPIQVCDGSGAGVTTVNWNANGISATQVRVGSPTGTLFAAGGALGSAATGKWVTNGLTFYLLDAMTGATLATATAQIVTTGCGVGLATLNATPQPIQVCDGSGLGVTTLTWNAPGFAATRLLVGSPTGVLFTSGGTSGSAATGKWVNNGLTFYLLDAATNAVLTTTTVNVTNSGCGNGPLSATPNPIPVCDSSGLGIAMLSWNAPNSAIIEVHVGLPTGPLFARGMGAGSATTGKWVSQGMQFFLQDVSAGGTGVTLGSTTVALITAGCR
jgi:hypothetical protein